MADNSTPAADNLHVPETIGSVADRDMLTMDGINSPSTTVDLDSPAAATTSVEANRLQGPTNEDVLFLAEFLARVSCQILIQLSSLFPSRSFLIFSGIRPKVRDVPIDYGLWRGSRREG